MGKINPELERLQLISDFLKGKFSSQQLKNFEKRLEKDSILQEELHKHKKLIELLRKKQEQNIASLLECKNDVDYMKQGRIQRREELHRELEKIKDQKIHQQENWELKIAQSNQPSIYKMAAIFFGAIAIGASVFVFATQLIDTQKTQVSKAEVTAPILVEMETGSSKMLDKTQRESFLLNKNKEVVAQNSDSESDKEKLPSNPNNNSISENEDLLAYQPIEELESKLNRNTRSSISLISPSIFVENYDKNLIFEWKGTSEEDIYLEIIDSRKISSIYKNLKSPFKLSQELKKGAYYWILQTESEVIKRGKFLVK